MTYTSAELLAPAGTPEALDAAIGEGADAVYLGLKTFNARMRTGNFAYSQFEAAAETLHKAGKKLYVTVNTVFEQREADRMYQMLQYLERVGADAIIVQDLGVVQMVRENFPGLKLHASTQMNVGSAPGVNFLSRHGFKRAVLSRELSLDEIRAVRASTNVELETFVHGALCVSGSGICLFSSYLGGRSANRGACTQACRRLFRSERDADGYFFSPDDLQLVDKVPDLIEAGVSSFKIEGRMKSAEYVGSVVAAYRYMMDNWRFDRERAALKALSMLQSDFARRKTSYWFAGQVDPAFIRPDQSGGTGIALGKIKVVRVFEDKRWMQVRHYDGIAEGDSIRVHRHGDEGRLTARVRGVMDRPEGLFLQADCEFGPEDEVYLVQTKAMSRRYKPVLPASLDRYRKFPSFDKAPLPKPEAARKEAAAAFPPGMYAAVSRVQDLHMIQSDRPDRAVIRLTRKNAELMRKQGKELPFRGEQLVIWLEPFFPQADADWLAEEVDYWISQGQKTFIANNLGHLNLLKGKACAVAAGPWLYAFNAYAAAFLTANGADYIMPPLEISKQNLGKLTELLGAECFFPVVFAYPPLFTIRADMGRLYDFRFFHDREGDDYELVNDQSGSVVIPAMPYSIVDRVPFLKKEGMGRFLLDFSFVDIKKPAYRRVMSAARDGIPLPETGRFNWKEGFWNPEEQAPARKADSGDRPHAAKGARNAAKGGPKTEVVQARYEAAVARAKKAAGRPGRGGKPQWFELEAAAGGKPEKPARKSGAPRPAGDKATGGRPARPASVNGRKPSSGKLSLGTPKSGAPRKGKGGPGGIGSRGGKQRRP